MINVIPCPPCIRSGYLEVPLGVHIAHCAACNNTGVTVEEVRHRPLTDEEKQEFYSKRRQPPKQA